MDQIITWDHDLFLFLNGLGSNDWDGFWLTVTDRFTFVPLYALLLFLIYRKMGWSVLLRVVVVAAAMILITDQVTNLFKYGFERLRPCREPLVMDQMRMVADHCGLYGFFSAHASNTMATAVLIGLLLRSHFKWLLSSLVLWSVMVAYSRIYVGVHYPIDVLCGLLFGAISGWTFYKVLDKWTGRLYK